MSVWLAVIGIGEEGWNGLSGAARGLIEAAELIVGGERHLSLIPKLAGESLEWKRPLADTLPEIERWRSRRVAVLASGDPLCYGVGALLARRFGADDMIVLPCPSAFSLAASRLLWPLETCRCVSLHGRPLDKLRLHLSPGARLLALSEDGTTPVQVAASVSIGLGEIAAQRVRVSGRPARAAHRCIGGRVARRSRGRSQHHRDRLPRGGCGKAALAASRPARRRIPP
jgi:precorrin-6B C5,15-methyltransferase / cobalt-precorrin-6B C5,C15-methyltransferase